ncbi:cyclin-dependent kinase inhibitor far1 [Kappamyces sp. JEL0829]|nr:cyclin-dependent kinase inhibitor far1 [Kappamyces sp. JEL0829]
MNAFFRDKTILVTGATGFVGLVLVETILQKTSFTGTLILLVRNETGLPPQVRNDPRVCVVSGFDLGLPGLGLQSLSPSLKGLLKSVHLVYHSAAIVQWNVPFKTHLQFNTLATLALWDLCHSDQLELFCFMSTMAVISDIPWVKKTSHGLYPERIEKPSSRETEAELKRAMEEGYDPKALFKNVDPETIGRSYYAYSKRLAEHTLYSRYAGGTTSILVVRLCSMDVSHSFPYRGFGHNYHAGPLANLKYGVVGSRILPDFPIASINSYPVDVAVNGVLAHSCYNSALVRDYPDNFRVINMESNRKNPVSIVDRFEASSHLVGPVVRMPTDQAVETLLAKAKHGDEKAKINLRVIRWYVPPVIRLFHDEEMQRVLPLMSAQEKQDFMCDIASIHWPSLLREGVDRFLETSSARL